MNDYVCWSAPTDDLGDWRYEGVIYKKDQDPKNRDGKFCLYAPDMQQGPDGRVAGGLPDDPLDFHHFDPGVLVDNDASGHGHVYLYSGFAPRKPQDGEPDTGGRRHQGAYFMELEQDMLTIKQGPALVFRRAGEAEGTGFEGHEFFEASSLRKVKEQYYFIYSSINGHELCYAVSGRPGGGFHYGGTIISNGDIFLDGRKPCNLYLPGDQMYYPHDQKLLPEGRPYMTQDGSDRESGPNQHIANFRQGAVAGFKYFQIENAARPVSSISVTIRGDAEGVVKVSTAPGGEAVSEISIAPKSADWREFSASCALKDGKTALYFTFQGEGSFDFLKFRLGGI
jgi:hypothetical protein